MAETGRRTKQCPTLHATDVVQNLLLVQSETFLVHENWSDALSDVKDGWQQCLNCSGGWTPQFLALPPNDCPRDSNALEGIHPKRVHSAADSNDKERAQCSRNDLLLSEKHKYRSGLWIYPSVVFFDNSNSGWQLDSNPRSTNHATAAPASSSHASVR